MRSRAVGVGLVALAVAMTAGCDDATSPAGNEQVTVAFNASGSTVAAAPAGTSPSLIAQDVSIQGTNRLLVIQELRVIVAEFELDRLSDDGCEEEDDACEEFEVPPAFVDVPLDGGEVVAVTAAVEPDTYDELEFGIEDLDDDEEDPVAAQQIEELRNEILAEFPDWPRDASMRVVGTFTPTGGEAVPFRVYFEAEVEIELDLSPPATITDDGSGATFTVSLSPAGWFTRGDGTVMDLSAFDFGGTGEPVEFEFEMENGFSEVEFDDD